MTDEFKPALRTMQSFQRIDDGCGVTSRHDRRARRDQRVFNLELPDQRKPHAIGLARVRDLQRL